MRGEAINNNKSFGITLYTKHITIEVTKVGGGGVAINVSLVSSRSTSAVTPRLFGDDVLKPMQYGLIMTDGSINKKCYPVMGTNHIWQSVVWALMWPGRNGMRIHAVSLNETDVSIEWYLMSVDHRYEFVSKAKVAEDVPKLDEEKFLTFLLFAIFGDGDINVGVKRIGLVIGGSKHELWRGIIDRMRTLGFRDIDRKVANYYEIYSSKAIELARKWLSNPMIKALVEDLALLPDAGKLRRLLTLANIKIKPRGGRSSVEVAGVWMNVRVGNNRVELVIMRSRLEDAETILKKLRNAGYNAKLSKRNKNFAVYIGHSEVMKHQELVAKVCEVLRGMLNEAMSENKARRAKAIAKAMANLNCPAQGPRAQ